MARVPRRRVRAPARARAFGHNAPGLRAWLSRGAHPPARVGHEITMPVELYLAYVLACILIAIIPGPTVTVIIGNSLKYGMRAGLLNVAGTQLGLALMMLALIV